MTDLLTVKNLIYKPNNPLRTHIYNKTMLSKFAVAATVAVSAAAQWNRNAPYGGAGRGYGQAPRGGYG